MSDFYKNINLNLNKLINLDDPTALTDAVNLRYLQSVLGVGFDNIINVSSSGTDTYIGVGTPTITSYDINTVYIVTFANANTITTPTLNIDGLGVTTIVKTDITGIVPLDVADIVNAVQYFLTYNGSQFQLYLSSPIGTSGTYTNLNPVPITQGGILSGTTFNSVSITSVFDMLLYPYQLANFNTFDISGQPTTLEVGNSVTSGSKTFTWSTSNSSYITPNTIEISKITSGTVILATALANTGSTSITLGSAVTLSTVGSYTWQIKGTRTNSTLFTRNFTVNWLYKMFADTSPNTILTAADVLAMSGNLQNTINGTYAFAANNYKYFAIPNNLPNPTLFKDQATNLNVGMADATDGYTDTNAGVYSFKNLSVTNPYGITQTYRVYRTKYTLGGSINIIIS